MITIFKIIIIFIILRYVLKLLSPFILRYFLKRVERKIKNNFNRFHKDNIPFKKEKNKQKSNDDPGEYIDFEEVD
tara:strand:- start:1461 stop:1685 length:225 start_codon:yes stop_codon:yes gene_type:complete